MLKIYNLIFAVEVNSIKLIGTGRSIVSRTYLVEVQMTPISLIEKRKLTIHCLQLDFGSLYSS